MHRRDIERKLLWDWDWFLEFGSALDDEILAREVTPDCHDPNVWWTVKDHIAHIYGASRGTNRNIRGLAFKEEPWFNLANGQRFDFDKDDPVVISAAVNEGLYNVMMEHRNKTWPEIIALGEQTKSERLALLGSLTDEQIALEIPAPYGRIGGGDGTLGSLLTIDGFHQRMHIGWILHGLIDSVEHNDHHHDHHHPEDTPKILAE